jgi:hypothetical protein
MFPERTLGLGSPRCFWGPQLPPEQSNSLGSNGRYDTSHDSEWDGIHLGSDEIHTGSVRRERFGDPEFPYAWGFQIHFFFRFFPPKHGGCRGINPHIWDQRMGVFNIRGIGLYIPIIHRWWVVFPLYLYSHCIHIIFPLSFHPHPTTIQ